MSLRHKLACLLVTACLVGASMASAQAPAPALPSLPAEPEDTLFFVQNIAPLPAFGAKIDVLRSEGNVEGPVVKDKPYSARSITESTQTLADGNRIVQRNEAAFYRDSAGRTRREQTLGGIGPWATGEPVTIINIHDPVANKTYMLDPTARIAREIKPFRMAIAHAEQIEAGRTELEAGSAEVGGVFTAPVPPPMPVPGGGARGVVTVIRNSGANEDVRVYAAGDAGVVSRGVISTNINAAMGAYEPAEDLGDQVLEGLLVHGTRMKDTIPAGAMGNERPIEIVTERWYSKDIDAMVLQRFSDPRFGETVSQLVNVVRGDPSADLFQVPQGYELAADEAAETGIRVGPARTMQFELRREPGAPAQQ
jgi:hypothetical protein